MSADESDDQGGAGRREVAYRLFAAEFDDADLSYSESDEERAPNYVVTPTGARVNRLFVVGVLTEVENVSEDVLRARVVDPTGAFVLYAGQYQPDEQAFLERADPPTFVAVTGKARTFQPDDSDQVFTSVRPESISTVDAETRDRWTVQAAEQTIDRVDSMATALALGLDGPDRREALVDRGVEEGVAEGIDLAIDHYGTTPTYLAEVREMAVDGAKLVADRVDEVTTVSVPPNASGDVMATDLLDEPVEPAASTTETAPTSEPTAGETPETSTAATADADANGAETESIGSPDAAVSETASEAAEPEVEATETPTTEPETESVESASGASETAPESTEPEQTDSEPTEPEPTAAESDSTDETDDGPGDFEPGEYDLDEDEREEIEEEYGTDFQSGTEVEDPGEADIETPDPEAVEASEETTTAEPEPTETEPEPSEADTEPPAETDLDLEDAVVETMTDLDEGDGANREAVVAAVLDRSGADPDAVEDAIQDALMDGRCYEPDEDTLKPI
ncbi:RPA family protein [Halobacteriales archaeon Cl-PHB]